MACPSVAAHPISPHTQTPWRGIISCDNMTGEKLPLKYQGKLFWVDYSKKCGFWFDEVREGGNESCCYCACVCLCLNN